MPLTCGMYLTSKCNFKCWFCNIWRKTKPQTLPFEKAKSIVKELGQSGCYYLSASGGEPLLADYLLELLVYAKKTGVRYTHFVTNGYLLDDNIAKDIAKARIDDISISIDGPQDFHDKNRACDGAYAKAINAIKSLKEYAPSTKIVLNSIIFPEDPTKCLHVVELANKLNVYAKFQPLNQHYQFNKKSNSITCRTVKDSLLMRKVIHKLIDEKCVVNSRVYLENMYNFFCDRRNLIFSGADCILGYHHVDVQEDGSVYPCLEGMNWTGGFITDGNIEEVLRSSQYKRVLQSLRECNGCQKNYYICYYEPRIVFPINNFVRNIIIK